MTLPFFLTSFGASPPSDDDERPQRLHLTSRSSVPLPHSDQELLSKLPAQDVGVAEAALETIFRAWHASLIAFARVLVGDDAIAQDVVQEIFIDIWRRRTTLTLSTSLAAYLHAAVRHRALTRQRDTANRTRILGTIAAAELLEAIPSAMPADTTDAWDESDEERRFRMIIESADRLPPRAREVFYLRWRQELAYREIAVIMDISVKTVEAQMTIALRRIREDVRGL